MSDSTTATSVLSSAVTDRVLAEASPAEDAVTDALSALASLEQSPPIEYGRQLRRLDRLLPLAVAGGRRDRRIAGGLVARGRALVRAGRMTDAREDAAAALAIADEIDEPALAGDALSILASVHEARQESTAALERSARAVAAHARSADAVGHARALLAQARLLTEEGRLADAAPVAERALGIARLHGSRATEATALHRLAMTLIEGADREQARTLLDQARVAFRDAGDRLGEAVCLGDLGLDRLRDGRVEPARALLERACVLGAGLCLASQVSHLAARIALEASAGNVDLARTRADDALALTIESEDVRAAALIDLHRAFIDLAIATQARARAEVDLESRALVAARRRLQRGRSFAALGQHLRIGCDVLAGALEIADQRQPPSAHPSGHSSWPTFNTNAPSSTAWPPKKPSTSR